MPLKFIEILNKNSYNMKLILIKLEKCHEKHIYIYIYIYIYKKKVFNLCVILRAIKKQASKLQDYSLNHLIKYRSIAIQFYCKGCTVMIEKKNKELPKKSK